MPNRLPNYAARRMAQNTVILSATSAEIMCCNCQKSSLLLPYEKRCEHCGTSWYYMGLKQPPVEQDLASTAEFYQRAYPLLDFIGIVRGTLSRLGELTVVTPYEPEQVSASQPERNQHGRTEGGGHHQEEG